jgi:protein-S-isoprenylcysteine O-methyltransferase Ste14
VIVILSSHSTSPWATATESYLCPSGFQSSSALSNKSTGPNTIAITPSFLAGFGLLLFGGLLRAICYQTLGSYFTYLVAVRKDHKLITSGPYAYVRHPAYLGGVTFFIGFAHAFFARGSYFAQCWSLGWGAETLVGISQVLIVCSATFTRAVTEDALMKKQFGKEWEEWAQKVRYRIIPGVW